ncbi:MAG: hypothetical protein UHO11_04320 [Treponema sp.]|nr:hypothetical protein [Treponema sp.]
MEHDFLTRHQGQYKDRLFKFIFGRDDENSKKWRLELYNALNGTNYTDPDALELNTIENVIYITMHNDISFLLGTEMNLYEQQSSRNPNMPLRGLLYFSQLYQNYLTKNGKNLISTQLVKIPTPEFIVFYTGSETDPKEWTLKLSDAFMNKDNSGAYEWTAKVLNIHPVYAKELQKSCKALYDYSSYVYRIKNNIKSGMKNDEAIEEAITWAEKQHLLGNFFKIQKAEVIGMSLTEFDEDEFKRICREDGRKEKAIEDARNLYINGVSIEIIAKSLNMTIEQVNEIVKEPVSLQR